MHINNVIKTNNQYCRLVQHAHNNIQENGEETLEFCNSVFTLSEWDGLVKTITEGYKPCICEKQFLNFSLDERLLIQDLIGVNGFKIYHTFSEFVYDRLMGMKFTEEFFSDIFHYQFKTFSRFKY